MSSPPRPLRLLVSACVVGVAFLATSATVAAQPPIEELLTACDSSPENPYLTTTCFQKGDEFDDQPAVIALHDTPDNSNHFPLATAAEVGAVNGLAYHGRLRVLFAASFHKRGTHFGPSGPGAIYAIDLASGAISTFAQVPDAGPDVHDPANHYFPDTAARALAGKTSLGDLDVSPDGSELAVVNLNDRRIYRFSTTDGSLLGSFAHGAAGESWSGDARPFGLGYRGDRLFHGVVHSAESSQDVDDLMAIVYESGWDGGALREVASAGLDYPRGWLWPNEGTAVWHPWLEPPGSEDPRYGRYAQPILADIVFTEAGDQMILGFRDRFGDQVFYSRQPTPPPPGELFNNVPGGDILPAWPEGDGWRIQTDPEYYTGDYGPRPSDTHEETSFGGLVVLPGQPVVATSANSPEQVNSAGLIWLSVDTGASLGREHVYSLGEDNFGKANGLGDMEVLCDTLQQVTPTPTSTIAPSFTPTSTGMPSATPSATSTTTAVPTLTSSPPPSPTVTAQPPTSTGTVTARPPDDEPDSTPVPATPVLPGLPQTGGGPGGIPLLALLLLAGLGVARILRGRLSPSFGRSSGESAP